MDDPQLDLAALSAPCANPDRAAELYADYISIDLESAKAIVNKAIQYDNWGAGFNAEAIEQAVTAQRIAMDSDDLQFCDLFQDDFLPENVSDTLPDECK